MSRITAEAVCGVKPSSRRSSRHLTSAVPGPRVPECRWPAVRGTGVESHLTERQCLVKKTIRKILQDAWHLEGVSVRLR